MSRHVLVVGANRGIGLELARQLVARGDHVTATCRTDRGGLERLGCGVLDGIDLARRDTLAVLGSGPGLDDLIVNAGIYPDEEGLEALDTALVLRDLEVNAVGPLAAVQAALPRLHEGSRVVLITSRMGSIGDNDSGGSYGYRMSKAALNMAGKTLSIDLAPRGVAVALVHPGWVRTDMTAGQGLIDARESAAGILARLDDLHLGTTGTFWHQNGQTLPW